MKNAYAEFQTLHRAWTAMREARKSENNLEPYGLKGVKAEDFDALFTEWDKALAAAAGKTKPIGAEEKALEVIIVYSIGQLMALVSPATSNGLQWLIQSAFLTRMAELNTALTPILDSRFRVRKAVVEFAKADLIDGMVRVEAAAPLADQLVAQQATITEQAEEVAEALTDAQAAKVQAAADAAAIATHLEVVEKLAADVSAAKADYDETITEANDALAAAQNALLTVEKSRKDADARIDEGARKIAAATEKLDKAIADVNRQGLAGSYQISSEKMGRERNLWLLAFAIALVYIALVASGAIEKWLGVTTTSSEVYWIRLLHLLPLASPGIWLGWFAARSAGLTARIQQDYAYKVATAQAYEGHKKEATQAGSEQLATQLMEATIRNFGDNPIRLYDGKGMEGHPLESLKLLFADKDYFDKLLKLLEAVKPGGKG